MNAITKERSSNFTAEELTLLRNLIDSHQNIILNKKSDAVHVKEKDQTWEVLASQFNASCPLNRFRSTKQLRSKFENMKKSARKESSQFVKERRRTGGGPPPTKLSDNATWMQGAMQLSMEGNTAQFDDDASLDAEIMPTPLQAPTDEVQTQRETDTLQTQHETDTLQTPYLMEFVTMEDPPLPPPCSTEYLGIANKRTPMTPSLKSLSRKRKSATPNEVRRNFIDLAQAQKSYVNSSKVLDQEHKIILHEQEYRHREAIFELKIKQMTTIHDLQIKQMELNAAQNPSPLKKD